MNKNTDRLALARACATQMLSSDHSTKALGIQISIPELAVCEARMTVRKDMLNGHDICHGGMIFTLADSAFAFACNAYNEITVAGSASIEFLQPAKLGDQLTATARQVYKGKRSGLYNVLVHNRDLLIAVFLGRSAALGKPLISDDGQ